MGLKQWHTVNHQAYVNIATITSKVGCLNCNLAYYNITYVERNELVQYRMSGEKEQQMVEPFGKHYSSVRFRKLLYFQMEIHKIIQSNT